MAAERQIAIVGPTAVGKTAVGIALAKLLDAEIISADSMQVYRRMDIGTAKPSALERAEARFHLVDMVEPDQEWTLSDFQAASRAVEAEIAGRGKRALIVGGTGLYIRALTTDLEIPAAPPDEELRERWRLFALKEGNEALRREVARVDPESATRIHVNDIKRLIRALEVHAAHGVSLTELHRRNREQARAGDVLVIGLNYGDRRRLYRRIEQRVDLMMAEGLLGEVRRLLADGYSGDLKPMRSLGYRHMCQHLAGDVDLAAAVDTMKADTRHFARRQLIWFRGDERVRWLEAEGKSPRDLSEEIADHLVRDFSPL